MNPILTTNSEALSVNRKAIISITILIQITIILFLNIVGKTSMLFLILLSAIIVLATVFSVRRTLILFVAYISIFPLYPHEAVSKVFKFQFSIPVGAALLLLVITFWFFDCLKRNKFLLKFSYFDKAVFLFLMFMGFSALIGFTHSYQNFFLLLEIFFLSLYIIYFIVVSGVDEKWVHYFFKIFTVISLIVSFGYILVAMYYHRNALFPFRLVTQQPRLAFVSIPYLLALTLHSSSHKVKLVALISVFCLSVMALISLTRGVWLGLIVSLLTFFFIHAFVNKSSRWTFFRFTILMLLIPGLIFFSFTIIQNIMGGSSGLSIIMRMFTLKNPFIDPSLAMRMIDYGSVIKKMGIDILWGRGLGDVTSNVALKHTHNIVDNSYIYLFWKTGLLGLGSFLALLLLLFQRCFYVLRNSLKNKKRRIIALSTISCFAGLIVCALADTTFTTYRFIVIWAILMGSIEILAKNISAERKKSLSVLPP